MIFCLQINTKVFYKLIVSLWLCVARHAQSTLNIKFSISLQYLEREVRNGVHFLHADKHQSFYNLALSFLMEVVRHVQSTQNKRLVIFLQYIKKKCCYCLCVLLCCKTLRYFMGVHCELKSTFDDNLYCEIIDRYFNIFFLKCNWKKKNWKAFLGTRVWVPKQVYWSPKQPEYVIDVYVYISYISVYIFLSI